MSIVFARGFWVINGSKQVFPADFGGKAGVAVALIALAPYCLTGAEVAACSMSLAVSFG